MAAPGNELRKSSSGLLGTTELAGQFRSKPPTYLDPSRFQQTQSGTATNTTNLGADANGNPLRRATKTGHVSNYDESKVRPYTLPDPLVLANGTRVRGAATWRKQRRQEILRRYEKDIYGRIPADAPSVSWRVDETDPAAREGRAIRKRIVGLIGSQLDGPRMNLTLYTPSSAKQPVPIILLLNFGGPGKVPPQDPPVAADIIARGWGYATVVYQDIQPDRINTFDQGVIGVTLGKGRPQPAPDEWGAIGAWSWGVSRIIDYFETDKSVNAKQVALFGHSRLGKTEQYAELVPAGKNAAAIARQNMARHPAASRLLPCSTQ